MSVPIDPSWDLYIVGFGNPQRRDDGIGSYIVRQLKSALTAYDKIGFLSVRHPEPSIVDELHGAEQILFVDATIEVLTNGWQLHRIQPELEMLPYTTHHFTPMVILGMIKMIYGQSPPTWVLTVEGCDFGFGRRLTSTAKKRARSAISATIGFVRANLQTPLIWGQTF
ncbi:MAG: hydrogenase maturation protease [Desulfobacterales bacterium]|nr:MAG: hydrogenase maturation protease [Desulfobacterales bacterium]